jgi:hypothetical protein
LDLEPDAIPVRLFSRLLIGNGVGRAVAFHLALR